MLEKEKEVRFVIVGEHSNQAAFVLSADRYREWRSERYAALRPAYDAIQRDRTLSNNQRTKRSDRILDALRWVPRLGATVQFGTDQAGNVTDFCTPFFLLFAKIVK
jgi:PHD/YefM family antitoxin component YafN of YafNO toxin-antitoxin module